MSNFVRKINRVIRDEGFGPFVKRRLRLIFAKPQNQNFPVRWNDAIDAFRIPPHQGSKLIRRQKRVSLGWVMPPPSAGSGGHQNMFRFIKFAENAGFDCRIYFYVNSTFGFEEESLKAMLRESGAYPEIDATMEIFERDNPSLKDLDAIFASSWESAFGVHVAQTDAKRLYFVQDYEPYFYPVGSRSILAAKTYDFGFTGLTAGGWLAEKLKSEHHMETYAFDFAIDRKNYFVTNPSKRDEIFFYARASTERRGFELGLFALSEVMRRRPETIIHFAGEAVQSEHVPFDFVSHGMLAISDLRELYNRCGAALVISATNMSLLPLELLACGVVPVVNQGDNNSMVSSNDNIIFVEPSPIAMASALIQATDLNQVTNPSIDALSQSVSNFTWDDSGEQFLEGLEKALYG